MKKSIFILLLLLGIANTYAAVPVAPITFKSCTPADGTTMSSIQNMSFTFDLSAVYNYYPDKPQTDWGITAVGNSTTSATRRRVIQLFKGTDTDLTTGISVAICVPTIIYTSPDFVSNSNTIYCKFDQEIPLEAGVTYTLLISDQLFSASTPSFNGNSRTNMVDGPITITLTGASEELPNAIMDSYQPRITDELESLNNIDVTFKYKDGYDMTVAEEAIAYLQEFNQPDVPTTSITTDTQNKNIVHFNFGNTTLYKGHTYNIYIPKNTVFPIASDGTTEALTDKGNKEITTIVGYKGASYKYLTTGRISPSNNSKLSYLSVVNIPFNFNDGYAINRQKTVEAKLYKGEELIGTYTGEPKEGTGGTLTTVSIAIWKFNLDPNSSYRLVMEKGQIPTVTVYPITGVPDVTNDEIVLTYTTPTTLETVNKVSFQSSTPADGAEIEKLETITLNIGKYSLDNTDYYLKIADAAKKALLYEVINGVETELQQIELALNADGYSYTATGTVGRTLYKGKTYKLHIPAGYFCADQEHLTEVSANAEATYTFTGGTDPYGLNTEKSSIQADAAIDALGMVAFYFKDDVTAVENAQFALYKGEETPAVATAPLHAEREADYTRVYADFSSADCAPFATEEKAAYKLTLPKGSVVSAADDNLMNGELSVAFTGMIPTEYVNITCTVDNVATQTQVEKGKTASYTLTPETDWEVESLLFNEEDVKTDMAAGVYTTPELTADATVKVILKYNGATYEEASGIVTIPGSNLKAYSEGGKLIVENLVKEDAVTVFSIGGSVLLQFTATDDKATIDVPTNATYLVRVNSIVMKLANK